MQCCAIWWFHMDQHTSVANPVVTYLNHSSISLKMNSLLLEEVYFITASNTHQILLFFLDIKI